MEHPPFKLYTFPQSRLLALVHHLLRRLRRYPRKPCNLLRCRQTALNALIGRLKTSRSKTPLLRHPPVDHPPRQYHLHRLTLPDRTRQPLRAPRPGYCPQCNLRLPKLRPRRAVQDIRHHRQLASTAQRVPIHGGDQRLGHGARLRGPRGDEVVAVGLPERLVAHLGDVGASGKGLLTAGEDDGADVAIGVECAQGGVEFGEDGGREGVEFSRAVERYWLDVSLGSEVESLAGLRSYLDLLPVSGWRL